MSNLKSNLHTGPQFWSMLREEDTVS